MGSSFVLYILNILVFLSRSDAENENESVLKLRLYKPVERFTDLVSFDRPKPIPPSNKLSSYEYVFDGENSKRNSDLKFILQWTPANHKPFLSMGVGQQGFIDKNCLYTNCYVTSFTGPDKDITEFDAILFNGPDVIDSPNYVLPRKRLPHQKYVFVSTQPSDTCPLMHARYDGFFNWTWTYKLDSDLVWGSIVVTYANNTVFGPKPYMTWMKRDQMHPVKEMLQAILHGKKKAVAWFPTKCNSSRKREFRIKALETVLKSKYNLTIDIYGECGNINCTVEEDEEADCMEVIRNDYYFYLAYEDTLSEDYVTELLPAVKYNAVPIVYGGADYRRFLPDGSYLNAREMTIYSLAAKIDELMHDFNEYSEYFKWTNHYKYFSTLDHEDTIEQCKMCEIFNDKSKFSKKTVYYKFREWWSPIQYRAKFRTTTTTTPKPKPKKTSITVRPMSRLRYFAITTPKVFLRPITLEDPVTKQPNDFFGRALDFADKLHNALGLKRLFPSIKTMMLRNSS